jgi:P-type Mg2+ transporter
MVLGSEIDRLSDTALGRVAEQSTLFARVSPAQKNRIILALRARGHVVGYLGDGINDAPALHSADVGISVASAVDVARDAADVILLERALDVLHAGIMEGRRAFGNVMKYLLMATSSNFGNMFSMAIASAVLPFLPMLPAQILLNNMLYDVAQVSIGSDHVDDAYVRKPRHWNVAGLKRFMITVGPVSSVFDFLTFVVLLRVLRAGEREFHTGWFLESLVTQVLVLFVIRTPGNPLVSRPSRAFVATATCALVVGATLPFTPLGPKLGFVSVPASYLGFVVLATAAYLLAVNAAKRRAMRFVLS